MKRPIIPILAFLIFPILTQAQFPDFKVHKIGEYGSRMGQTALVDIDEDGDLDWVFGIRGDMYWYENVDADTWIKHDLGKGAKTDVGGCAADINRDGKTDFMCGDGWYENTGTSKNKIFVYHHTGTLDCHDDVMGDIDGDGIEDVISDSNDKNKEPVLAWYRIPQDFTAKWEKTIIADGIHGGIDPKGIADLDNDGDMDIVRGDSWFENLDGMGKQWKEYNVLIPEGGSRVGPWKLALKSWTTDLDNDGDMDIIEAECDYDDCRVYWFENKGKGKKFKFHLITAPSTKQDFHSLAIADFDNDGDMDVFSGGGPLTQVTHKCFIWENIGGKGKNWKEHVVAEGYRCHEAKAADVDGDGDIDICTKPWGGNVHVYIENTLVK